MPHVFFFILIICGIVYGTFKIFVYMIDSFVLLDENFVSNVKERDNNILNYFISKDEDDKLDEETRIKMKRINTALRFDFFISTFIGLVWFLYPFSLIQLTTSEIEKRSPEDKYIGKWLGLIVIFTNIITLRYINDGKLLSKQSILLVKLLCSCIILGTTIMICSFTGKLYLSNIFNIVITSLWLSNSAVGLFLSHYNKEI